MANETIVAKQSTIVESTTLGTLKALHADGKLQFAANRHTKENGWKLPTNSNGKPYVVAIIAGESSAKTCYLAGDAKGATTLKELVNEPLVKVVNSDGVQSYIIGQSSAGIADVSDLF